MRRRTETIVMSDTERPWLRALLLRTALPPLVSMALCYVAMFELGLPAFEENLRASRRETIRELTTTVHRLVGEHADQVERGELTRAEAQERAIARIRELRYGQGRKDYFWINDYQCRMIMHPYRPDLEGQVLADYADAKGKHLFREFVTAAQGQGAGYVEYMWQWQDDPQQIVPKLSYVMGFDPWEWVIGTGVYLEDVRAQIKSVTARLRSAFAAILAVIAFLSAYIIWQGRSTLAAMASAERALGQSERRQALLVETMNDGLIVLDDQFIIRYANPKLCQMLGVPKAELVGCPLMDCFDEENRRIVAEQMAQRRSGATQPYEICWRTRQGDTLATLVSPQVMFEASRFSGAFAVVTDISWRRQAEEALRQLNAELEERVAQRTADLEVANRELEAFSYSVSHDLRAPLRRVEGFSQMLLEGSAERLGTEGQTLLNRVRTALVQMNALIDSLLGLSRIARGELANQRIDLSAMAREIADELRAGDPHRTAEWEIQGGLIARGDRRLMRAALANLLGNAWKFTREQPVTRIAFGALVSVGQTSPTGADATTYYVRDNGVGFDMAVADRLFAPFQRLHSQDQFEGIGIGLATVQRIIRRHRGRIWAEASPGAGATFYFTVHPDLPASAEEEDAAPRVA